MNPKFTAILAASLATAACNAQTIDGYDDIYIDTDETITVHTILCGDMSKPSRLRPTVVYTNSGQINEGAYSLSTPGGNATFIFKQLDASKPVMARGVLRGGETDKSKAVQDMCIVKQAEGLPANINGRLEKDLIEPNDPNWQKTMDSLAMIAGRPALAKGVYK